MKKKKLQCSVPTLLLAGVLCLTLAACGAKQSSDMLASDTDSAASAALPVKAMNAKRVDENPYMAKSDANIHHDGYNTDSTDEVLPLGIYPEINVSYEKTNANASPAIYFDSYGHAVVPLLGGIAIRDLNAEETTTLGYFSPKQHDGGGYVIQSSYTFLDSENRIVCPTSNNHVLMLRATDEAGNVLPEFEKVLDIDIKAAAEAALGKELTQNLLSVVFDYDGNLWFATGGFRIYPERGQQGVLGYIARSAIDAILNGEQADLSDAVFVYELTPGEGAENGIAASKDGAVILTKSKMTAMEYVKLLTELTAHVGQMLLTLRDTCGCCDECDEDECACRDLSIEELCRPAVTVPDWAREEADIPPDAKLGCYVDEGYGEITICETDYEYDLSDVPPAILFALRQSGCCLSVLEDVLMENDIVYDK